MTTKTHRIRRLVGTYGLLLPTLWGCAYSVPYVKNETAAKFELGRSTKHRVTDLVAYVDNDEQQLVVYGKVEHTHETCLSEGHLDLAIVDATGALVVSQSLPLVSRGGKRGWHGASFRTRISRIPAENSLLRLGFHDAECVAGEVFD